MPGTPPTLATPQLPGLPDDLQLLAESIAIRLSQAGCNREADRIRRCQTTGVIKLCLTCSTRYPLPWNCNQRLCPHCSRRIAARRADILRRLIPMLPQPKHVVLTMRNTWAIDPDCLAGYARALRLLRRRKLPHPWAGGTWTLEITNESRGWHPHYHLLVDTPWVDPGKLATTWARLVNQHDIAIIAVRDARETDYAAEVAKYVVKPAEIAAWQPTDLRAFVRAIRTTRAFGVWGNARKLWPRAKAQAEADRPPPDPCQVCQGTEFRYVPPEPEDAARPSEKPYALAHR
jgi:hypothetical protein